MPPFNLESQYSLQQPYVTSSTDLLAQAIASALYQTQQTQQTQQQTQQQSTQIAPEGSSVPGSNVEEPFNWGTLRRGIPNFQTFNPDWGKMNMTEEQRMVYDQAIKQNKSPEEAIKETGFTQEELDKFKNSQYNSEVGNYFGQQTVNGVSAYVMSQNSDVHSSNGTKMVFSTGKQMGGWIGAGSAALEAANSAIHTQGKKVNVDQGVQARMSSAFGTFKDIDDNNRKAEEEHDMIDTIRGETRRHNKRAEALTAIAGNITRQDELANSLRQAGQTAASNAQAIYDAMTGKNIQTAVSNKYGGILQRANNIVNTPKPTINLDNFEPTETISEVIEIVPESTEEVDMFQNGGSFNIIPEGALHARNHNMDIEGITKKGIPVISEDENGNIEQQAEIEHSEIIFRLEVTEAIEKAAKEYEKSNDENIPLEIGKMLTKEILNNTDDRTNLIDQV